MGFSLAVGVGCDARESWERSSGKIQLGFKGSGFRAEASASAVTTQADLIQALNART